MVEIRQQTELLEHGPRGGRAFGGRGSFAAAEAAERFGHSIEQTRLTVTAPQICCLVRLNQAVQLLTIRSRQYIVEDNVEMMPDETLQIIERKRLRNMPGKHLLDCAANVRGGVQQSTIQIEDINVERRDQA